MPKGNHGSRTYPAAPVETATLADHALVHLPHRGGPPPQPPPPGASPPPLDPNRRYNPRPYSYAQEELRREQREERHERQERDEREEREQREERRERPHYHREDMRPPPRVNVRDYWGDMITPTHPPRASPTFQKLLHAIYDYATQNLPPRETTELTPQKLSSLYREVGGDLDALFLQTPYPRLSRIFSALGCEHTLQPDPTDSFKPPHIPALTKNGWMVWETVQLLMDPGEHVPYMREAVRRWELTTEAGERLPREVPQECWPQRADKETVEWHEGAYAKVLEEEEADNLRAAGMAPPPPPPPPSMGPGMEDLPRDGGRARGGGVRPEDLDPDLGADPVYDAEYSYSRSRGRSDRARSKHRHYHHPPAPDIYATPATPVSPPYPRAPLDPEYMPPPKSSYRSYAPDPTPPLDSSDERDYDYRPSPRKHRHSTPLTTPLDPPPLSSRHPSQSRSRTRSYAVYSDGSQVPISYPVRTGGYYSASPPDTTYLRPASGRLHGYQSYPDLHGGYGREKEKRRGRSASSGRRARREREAEMGGAGYYEDEGFAGWDGVEDDGYGYRAGRRGGGRRSGGVKAAYY